MKKSISILTLGLALGFVMIASKKADASPCSFATCYVFDTVKEVDSTNFTDKNDIAIIGLVGGTEKSVNILVPKGSGAYLSEVIDHCLKEALLAQISPEKVQLSVHASVNESSNGVLTDLTNGDAVICSLQSR